MGVLSNTCRPHWDYCNKRGYGVLQKIHDAFALSYEIGCTKPDERIFRAAAELAGVAPEEIFFTDDIPSHVESARRVGFDAVQYTSVPTLAAELRKRGLRSNY
jgi:HAD superfamily hydrolase (TIGR01549 family)